MAMEKIFCVRDTHTRAITALGYFPARREILIGCEDGVIKTWETDAGRLMNIHEDHKGWVTDFLYWPDKLLLSSANDGLIIVWGSGGSKVDEVNVGQPVYCMAMNPRRHQLVCGVNGGIRIYGLDSERECGHFIRPQAVYVTTDHTDIVRCLICHESRVYSVGYDQKLIIYDSSYTGDESMEPLIKNNQAHDAGISCLLLVKDNENNTWIVTGSFDKTVRIWSTDGKLVHKLDGFLSTITGLCYVPRNKTIWAAAGSPYAYLYDPKSGDNVSDFIGTFQTEQEEKYQLQILKYFPEQSMVVASTSRRHLMVWKYNTSGCVTALQCRSALECLTYTCKVPLLVFSGDMDGVITKWERMQSNHFMYSKEYFLLSDAKKARRKLKKDAEKSAKEEHNVLDKNRINRGVASRYSFNKPILPSVTAHTHPNTTILSMLFVEERDLIVAACEDGNIYVWGFDEDAVKALKTMEGQEVGVKQQLDKYLVLLDQDSELRHMDSDKRTLLEEDSVTNRVAGFVCKFILSAHANCVTSLALVGRDTDSDRLYVLSAGWDRRICVWDLNDGKLHDTFRNASTSAGLEHVEMACDGIITDLAYCPQRKEFAYSSSDKMVYIRKFSSSGVKMVLLNTLQGHFGEVTAVKWNNVTQKWVTGSEDGTIRIWSAEALNKCEQVLSAQGSVSALCMDVINGAIVTGVQELIRVYEPDQYRLIQTNKGHTDSVRSIVHIPERNQYVSCSWDQTVRVWNAWKLPQKKSSSKDKKDDSLRYNTLAADVNASSASDGRDEAPLENNDTTTDTLETGHTPSS